jgi:hypothetical protein
MSIAPIIARAAWRGRAGAIAGAAADAAMRFDAMLSG